MSVRLCLWRFFSRHLLGHNYDCLCKFSVLFDCLDGSRIDGYRYFFKILLQTCPRQVGLRLLQVQHCAMYPQSWSLSGEPSSDPNSDPNSDASPISDLSPISDAPPDFPDLPTPSPAGTWSAIRLGISADLAGHMVLVSSYLYTRPGVGILRLSSLRIPLARYALCISYFLCINFGFPSPGLLRFSGLEVALTAEESL